MTKPWNCPGRIAWILALWLVLSCLGAAPSVAPGRPNVLLIVSEDTSPNLGCYGDSTVPTPNLDRLAAEGVRFDRAFVTTASCSESRSSILTGLYPHQNGQIGLATHRFHMYRDWPNISSLLRQAGYRTGILGKLHVNPESAFLFDLQWNEEPYCSFNHRDVRKIAEVAGEFIRASQNPFFLMVNYPDTHLPFLAQQNGLPPRPIVAEQVRMFPAVGLDSPKLLQDLANYYNCLARLDTGVGMLLDELRRSDRDENTLVIYLGDHGAQFPRGKLTCYESGLRVPMLVRWPGHVASGLVRTELVSTVDLLPTILAATGVEGPANLAGRSLLPLLGPGSTSWRSCVCSEYHAHYPPVYFPQRTVRDKRYQLIVTLLPGRPDPCAACYQSPKTTWSSIRAADVAAAPEPIRRAFATWAHPPAEQLFDLQADPYELNNLAGRQEYAEVQSRLREQLRRWREETRDPLLDPERLARLTREVDAVARDYSPRKKFSWQYSTYMDVTAPDR